MLFTFLFNFIGGIAAGVEGGCKGMGMNGIEMHDVKDEKN